MDDVNFIRSSSWRFIIDKDVTVSEDEESYISKESWVEMIHGLEYIIKIKNRRFKFAWLIFLIASTLVSIYLTGITISDFFENTTVTLDTIRRKQKILFHSITLCPKYSDTFNYTSVKNTFLDIRNDLDNKTVRNFIIYLSAGGGFDNYNNLINNFDDTILKTFENIMYDMIKYFGSLSNLYKFIFKDNNFKCEDFFDSCYAGDEKLNCCEIFEIKYILIRGKCYKLKHIYQEEPDELGKLSLTLKAVPSIFLDKKLYQEQVVVYNNPKTDSVAMFPRFYIYGRDWNSFMFTKQIYKLHYSNTECVRDINYQGLNVCWMNEWIRRKIHEKYNCTFFYLQDGNNLSICNPTIVIQNYDDIMITTLGKVNCKQACIREEVVTTLLTRPYSYVLAGIKNESEGSKIHLEMRYGKMQEYVYQDVLITTASGFISELGGHTGLFVGFTIITIFQMVFLIIKYLFREFSKMKIDMSNGIKL
uniref:Acid-sensing ion channel 1 n=1 Tax=Parastrongyloides trichosuri TaxID=131310 RepID=A0A0N4Z5L7_PARTI